MDEITRNARNKSIGNTKDRAIKLNERIVKRYIKLAFSIISISVALNVVQVSGKVADYFQKRQVVANVLEDSYDKVMEETHIASNKVDYYYDVSDLIDYVKEEPDKFPERLYGVLSGIGFDASYKIDELDAIICSVFKNEDGTKMYSSFEDFLIKNGHVDKDGKASVEVYKEKMTDYIYAKQEYMNKTEEIKGVTR